ncbi:MAG: hypothetical protein GF398_21355 [Chitinivibrionales bacterium]|nr:hypothetical protein [Chitinivibrionales bacterium]
MAYIGIGYTGEEEYFLRNQVDKHIQWLKGDRLPRFFGERFLMLYDSNTAREFAHKCKKAVPQGVLSVFPMERPFDT